MSKSYLAICVTYKSPDGSYCIRNAATCPAVRIILKITAEYMRSVYMYVFARVHTCVSVCRYALRVQWNRERKRIHQGVRGTHSNGRVIRDESIPPSMLECICSFFSISLFPSFSLSLSLLNLGRGFLRLIHTCNTPQKCRAGEERIHANQLHFTSAKRTETRDVFRIFLRAMIFFVAFVEMSRANLDYYSNSPLRLLI